MEKEGYVLRVGLLSSLIWIGRCNDNAMLLEKYKEYNVEATEIAWDSQDDLSQLDLIVVRSTWGYQNKYKTYLDKLRSIDEHSLLLNSYEVIHKNVYKETQFKTFERLQIPCAKTIFLQEVPIDKVVELIKEKLFIEKKLVLKPNISASGQDTVLIDNKSSESKIRNYVIEQFKNAKGVLLQEYLSEIENGEISLIFISGIFTYSVIRYPGIFTGGKETEGYSASIDLITFGEEIIRKMDLNNELYVRVDVVMTLEGPKVMEIELNEPDLFFRKIKDADLFLERFVEKSIAIYSRSKE